MSLRYITDLGPAGWITESRDPWGRLVAFGPSGFEAYARLRFIPDPVRHHPDETSVEMSDGHPTDYGQSLTALRVLREFTESLEEWYFCVWNGWPIETLTKSVRRGPLVAVPNREYVLVQGTSDDFEYWEDFLGSDAPPPAFAWPADHAWCFACDVDPHWAGIGGSAEAIESLMESQLDVVLANPVAEQPTHD